jgi:3-oxoacid CoA-transferase B subunit
LSKPRLTREQIAARAALELPDGAYVNLGWGIPNLVAAYVPPEITIYFHSENGILGMGPRANPGEEDFDLVDAMKVPVTLRPGAAFFSQVDAHVMTRGGHLDICILGGLQVSEKGDLANWRVPGAKGAGGIGGAMDISVGAERLIVTMEHTSKDGSPKIVKACTYPLTALECVHTIITDLAVIDVTSQGLQVREVAPGFSPEEVQAATEPELHYFGNVPDMRLPPR